MRIAVSGSHCTGKSTLIDEFLRAHPGFVHEPEPYTVLVDEFGEEFSAEPCVEDFLRQLEFNIDRLKQHERGERVIYERCPIDFLAYIECLKRTHPLPRGGSDPIQVDSLIPEVVEAVQNLDVIVYLPIEANIGVTDEEFPKLRKAVDRRLSAIYAEDDLGIISAANVAIVQATGPIEQRLRTLEAAM
jgi:predicted ATPase